MTAKLMRSKGRNVFFNNGPDNDPSREHIGWEGEMCLVLPQRATTSNSVVVLCRHGVREILYLFESEKKEWETL